MDDAEIEHSLSCCQAEIKSYDKNQKIFSQEDHPSHYIYLSQAQ